MSEGSPEKLPQVRSSGILRHRNFMLLWSGQSISVAGNGIFTVALPLEVLKLTDSSLLLAIVVGARTVPTILLLLIGGPIVDRLPRRAIMLASDLACGICVLAATLLILAGEIKIWELLLISVVIGLCNAFFLPATTAIVPDILPEDLLVSGSSLTSLSQSLGQFLVGPLAGGFIASFAGSGWSFGIDGISFLVSAACLVAMRNVITTKAVPSSMLESIREGWKYTRSQPWLWWSMIGLGLANFVSFVPLGVLVALLVEHVFHVGAAALGIVYASGGAGAAVMSLYVKRRGAPRRRVTGMWMGWIAAGIAAALIGFSPTVWVVAIGVGVMMAGVTYGNVLWLPLMQAEVPAELLGRISSLDWFVTYALSPLGTVIAGASAGFIGVRPTLIAGGVIAAFAGCVLFLPRVRELDRVARQPEQKVPSVPRT